MPKKPPRNNQRNRALRTVQTTPSILQRVMQRAGRHISNENQLSASLLARLPEGLRSHVIQVISKDNELVILTDSAAWAARVKLALAGDPELTNGRPANVKVAPRGAVSR